VKKGVVYLVGAGPGDPGLITVRGVECLRKAEVVIYDYLANPELLSHAPQEAERLYVGKLGGRHHTPQEKINSLLLENARKGKIVVRLKGGDPYVFGRGGEEAQALHGAGIPFEVVPGVTAAFAAAAYAGIPLTHRDFTTSLALLTGHESSEKKLSTIDWEKLSTGVGTLVFYMGMTNLPLIAGELMAFGRPPETPVAVVQWATTPKQRTLVATLADVVDRVNAEGIKPPAIIIVGEVVSLREDLRWFDSRPLFGKRILVTRTAEQAGEFLDLLRVEGAEGICHPTIAVLPPEDWAEVDAAIEDLSRIDVLILTSANAVKHFFDRLKALGKDARALSKVRIAVVGPKTGDALEEQGLHPDLVPEDYRAEGVIDVLKREGVTGKYILYPRADISREIIPRQLSEAGAEVVSPSLYRTVPAMESAPALRALLESGGVDAITFTSSSTAENLATMLGDDAPRLLTSCDLISIGPLTTRTIQRLGWFVAIEANQSTLEGMTDALRRYYADRAE